MNNKKLSVKSKSKNRSLPELKQQERRINVRKELTELQQNFLNNLFGEAKVIMLKPCVLQVIQKILIHIILFNHYDEVLNVLN